MAEGEELDSNILSQEFAPVRTTMVRGHKSQRKAQPPKLGPFIDAINAALSNPSSGQLLTRGVPAKTPAVVAKALSRGYRLISSGRLALASNGKSPRGIQVLASASNGGVHATITLQGRWRFAVTCGGPTPSGPPMWRCAPRAITQSCRPALLATAQSGGTYGNIGPSSRRSRAKTRDK
jgi:hypothetical protein